MSRRIRAEAAFGEIPKRLGGGGLIGIQNPDQNVIIILQKNVNSVVNLRIVRIVITRLRLHDNRQLPIHLVIFRPV